MLSGTWLRHIPPSPAAASRPLPCRPPPVTHVTCDPRHPVTQGGYFIINGSEKVLIAQERMATNHVYVFKKSQPSKYTYIAECRWAGGWGAIRDGSERPGAASRWKLCGCQ